MTQQNELGVRTVVAAETATDGFQQPPFTTPLVWPAGKASAIAYVDGVFDEQFCSSLITFCEDNPGFSFNGKTVSGVMVDTKVTTDWLLNDARREVSALEKEFDQRVFHQLWRVLDLYKHTIPQLSNPINTHNCMVTDTGYQIQKYLKNVGFYVEHIDGSSWNQISAMRTLGIVIYLNTVDTGGGTSFPMHDITIDAVAGRVAIFPANWTHPHCGVMPTSGDKWIISTFVEGSFGECTCGEPHE